MTHNLSLSLCLKQVLYHWGGNDWKWGATVCRVTTTALHCNMHCSVLTTCAIAFERYCGVVHPLRTKHWHTAPRAAIVCVLIWTLVLFMQTPLLKSDLTLSISPLNITTCYDVVPRKLFPNQFLSYLYYATILVLFYMLPLIALVGCYIAVVRQLRRSAVAKATEGDGRHALSRQWARTTVALATACFVFCYLPTFVLLVIHLVFTILWNKSLYAYYKLAESINSFNCFFDPFVYYFASMTFRQTLWKALGRCCRWRAPPEEREDNEMSASIQGNPGLQCAPHQNE